MKLHHCAYKISIGKSELIQKFCEFLGAKLIWEGQDQGREIVMQFDNNLCIQFSEIDEKSSLSNNKQETHLAFSSKNPKEDITKIENWFKENKIETKIGKWSETELWIDCPSVFINFVIEVLNIK
ncbi:MAG: hypothetical protein AB7V77_02260 [Candidatus Woesearchaeota archaeon]